MQGIFLHVLADAMGSVAVIASTLLTQYTGWMGWDPVASVLVALMIFASAVPLVRTCARKLMMVLPDEAGWEAREALFGVGETRGVVGCKGVRFWVVEGAEAGHGRHEDRPDAEPVRFCGVVHVFAAKGADVDDVRERTVQYLKGRDMDVVVQVEKEGEGRCWCGGGLKGPA
jgi:solute carrier family 30 (zinc transporter), member 5/7